MHGSLATIRKIFHIGNGTITVLITLIFLSILSSFLEIFSIQYTQSLSDSIRASIVNNSFQIAIVCGKFLLLIVCASIVRNFFCYKVSVFSNAIIKNIRNKAYSKMIEMEYESVKKQDSAFYINMINNNVARLDLIFSTSFFTLLSDIFDIVWICYFMIQINIISLLILIAGIPFLILIGNSSASKQRMHAENTIKLDKKLIEKINESNINLSYIVLFGGREREIERFNLICNNIMENDNLSSAKLSTFFVVEKCVRYFFITTSLFFLSRTVLLSGGDWTIIIPFFLYSQRFYSPFSNLNRYSQLIQKAVSSADKLIEFLNLKSSKNPSNIQVVENSSNSQVVLTNISKNYGSEKVLNDISVNFAEGINLIVGKSGAGKSTLLKIILGLIKPLTGEVTIYSSLLKEHLFSYSGQANELFNLSIIENLIYPRNKDDLSHSEVVKIKGLLEEFGFKQSVLCKQVDREGDNLSGGERKRLSVLRALYFPSRIVILDEPFANLDPISIEIIVKKIEKVAKNKVVLIVSHQTVVPKSLKIDKRFTLNEW